MTHMLCRNKVVSVEKWREVFRSHEAAHREAGLILEYLWRDAAEPENLYYLFKVEDLEKAKAFISAPDAGEAAQESGVIDGEWHFVESTGGY